MDKSRQTHVEILGFFFREEYTKEKKLSFSALGSNDIRRAARGVKVYKLLIPIPPEISLPEPPVPEVEGEVELIADEVP